MWRETDAKRLMVRHIRRCGVGSDTHAAPVKRGEKIWLRAVRNRLKNDEEPLPLFVLVRLRIAGIAGIVALLRTPVTLGLLI